MNTPHDNAATDRRRLLKASAAVAVGAGAAACAGPSAQDRQLQFATLAEALKEAEALSQAAALESATRFNWAQTLAHTAQSIEFSMTGFPAAKPALFQRTLGAAALGVFNWRGRMSHDLAEPIPGAPDLPTSLAADQALARLKAAIAAFAAFTGPLQPHFAYGALDKAAYERAHAMHLANHLSAFRAKPVA